MDAPVKDRCCHHLISSKLKGALPSRALTIQTPSWWQKALDKMLGTWQLLHLAVLPLQLPSGEETKRSPAVVVHRHLWLIETHFLEPFLKSSLHLLKPLWAGSPHVTIGLPLRCLLLTFCFELRHGFLEKLLLSRHRGPSQLLCEGHWRSKSKVNLGRVCWAETHGCGHIFLSWIPAAVQVQSRRRMAKKVTREKKKKKKGSDWTTAVYRVCLNSWGTLEGVSCKQCGCWRFSLAV